MSEAPGPIVGNRALERVSNGAPLRFLLGADLPGFSLAAALIGAWIVSAFAGGASRWGLSAEALGQGRFETLFTHMFAHAGLPHIWGNVAALVGLSAVVVPRLGLGRRRWTRYLGLLVWSGLAGAAVFLAVNPAGAVPMVGASGAICGLWGATARLGPEQAIRPIRSVEVFRALRAFAIGNAVLFAILFAIVRLSGGVGGLAWEAHLGGFLFGLFAGPRFVRGA